MFHQDPGLGTGGGMLVDYGGIPVNEASRIYALSFDASRMTVRQQQCPGYLYSAHFKRQADENGWSPTPCRAK